MDYRLVLAILSICFAIFPIVLFMCSKNEKTIKILFLILTLLYSIVVCIGVFTDIDLGSKITISTFENVSNIKKSFNFEILEIGKTDFLINILMFIPLGFLLAPQFKKLTFVKSGLIGLGFSLFIEIMQLVLPIIRGPELSDIILNTISCLIGAYCWIIFNLIKKRLKRKK